MNFLKQLLALFLARPSELIGRTYRHLKTRWIIARYHQRVPVSDLCAEKIAPVQQLRLLIVITHVVSPADSSDAIKSKIKLERLVATINGALRSFAHLKLGIVINTYKEHHVLSQLPEHLSQNLTIEETHNGDPMLIEYAVPDIFLKHRQDYDYFMFIEDDIVILDPWFLNKIEKFNRVAEDPELLLLPHRYEMNEGKKFYIDLNWREEFKPFSWNRMATFEVDGVKFGECGNSHAAFYCLSLRQLELWERTGRLLKNKVVMVGPLESAATGCLCEAFTTYKPHPMNLNYLEVEHHDLKYSTMLIQSSTAFNG
jgi:hypothetical protein